MMTYRDKLCELIAKRPVLTVQFGYGEIKLFALSELSEGQVGFSSDTWNPHWVVIGLDLAVGDPIIVDTLYEQLPVYSDYTGQGSWNPQLIAHDVMGFFSVCERWRELAVGRGSPMALETNPLRHDEVLGFLSMVQSVTPEGEWFWRLQLPREWRE